MLQLEEQVKLKGNGEDDESLSLLPCHLAALETCGFKTSIDTCSAEEMQRHLVELAKADHNREQARKKKDCKKRGEVFTAAPFDKSIVPKVDGDRRYVYRYSIAPEATAPHLWDGCPYKVCAIDFAHCTDRGESSGVVGVTVGFDANSNLIELGECLYSI